MTDAAGRAQTLVADAVIVRAMTDALKLGLSVADIASILTRTLEAQVSGVWVTVIVTPKETL